MAAFPPAQLKGATNTAVFGVVNYDLPSTLCSGQAFRWRLEGNAWTGIIGNHFVRLRADEFAISAEAAAPVSDWEWLRHYLQVDLDLSQILRTFPDDEPM